MTEEWRPIAEPDFADCYMVSSDGRIARVLNGSFSNTTGYRGIILSKKGVAYRAFRLHQLVARAFLGEQPEGTVVNHLDGDKTNNSPSNLEFITQKENVRHGIRIGYRKILKNLGNGRFSPILNIDQVGEIKALVNSGTPLHLIAKEYRVSTPTIRHIKLGKNWNLVPAKL